ncbi:MAG TPA: hypothetical protein VIF62_38995 [Labilithrix sp.]|jgi:hypothetical protein
MTFARFAALALVACAACGGAKNAAVAKAPDAPETKDAEAPKTDDGNAQASGKPESFVVVPHPARALGKLRSLLRGAPAALPVLDHAMGWAKNVDLDQPIYTVFVEGSSATSVGLTPEIAKATKESANTECDVVDGASGTRFVCPRGPDGASAKPLAGATPPEFPSDAHMEVDIKTLLRFGGGGAAALTRVTIGTELKSFTADVSLDGPGEVKAAVGLNPKGKWSAALLAAPVAAPPSTFARLPADAEIAFFANAPAAGDQGPFKDFVLDAITKSGDSCTPAETADARAHFEKVLFTGGSVAAALGFDRAAAETAADALLKAPADKNKQNAMKKASAAWFVAGVEEPAAKWLENVPWLAKSHCGKKQAPKVTVTPKPSPRLGLPAGSVEIIERRTKEGASPLSFTFIVPDKSSGTERTWIAAGDDENVVAARVRIAAKGDPDATLAKRSGIASLRDPATAAGFVTAAGVAWFLGDTNDPVAIQRAASMVARSRSLPTGARTPILFHAETAKADAKITARLSLDGAAIGDAAALYGDLTQ